MSKTLNKERISCRGDFFEEIKAIGVEKMHQIQTEIDKNTKEVKFLKILCSFCLILENLGGLDFQRRSTRNKLVVRKAFFKETKQSFLMKKKTDNLRSKTTVTSKCTDFSLFMPLRYICRKSGIYHQV